MRNIQKLACCVTLSLALTGCQSFMSQYSAASGRVSQPDASAEVAQSDLELGRAAIRAGNPGNAIVPLRMAALDPETAPDAFNALAVAYTQLGRADLAERYFQTAVTLAPNDGRFARNLARFYDSDLANSRRAMLARERSASEQVERIAQVAQERGLIEPEPTSERRGAIVLERGNGLIRRVSGRELVLTSRRAETWHTAEVASAAPRPTPAIINVSSNRAIADRSPEANADVSAATLKQPGSLGELDNSPVSPAPAGTRNLDDPDRVVLGKGAALAAPATRVAVNYPIRIQLKREVVPAAQTTRLAANYPVRIKLDN